MQRKDERGSQREAQEADELWPFPASASPAPDHTLASPTPPPPDKRPLWVFGAIGLVIVGAGGAVIFSGGDDAADQVVAETAPAPIPEYPMGRVEPGSFEMGHPDDPDAAPHRVTITRAFLLGRTEVTQGLFERLVGENPSFFKGCGPECPVEQVGWMEAAIFANAASRQAGLEECYVLDGADIRWPKGLDCEGFRLPTEAEWEYAARATSTTRYTWGGGTLASVVKEHAWYRENADADGWTEPHAPRVGPQPVGQLQPNAWGLYDMIGNVWEWCWDGYAPYRAAPATDPIGAPKAKMRVDRGGSWASQVEHLAPGYRIYRKSGGAHHSVGLRLARTAP